MLKKKKKKDTSKSNERDKPNCDYTLHYHIPIRKNIKLAETNPIALVIHYFLIE